MHATSAAMIMMVIHIVAILGVMREALGAGKTKEGADISIICIERA